MNIEECLEKGLLKHDRRDSEKVKKSIQIAEIKLKKAISLLKLKILDMAELNAYSAMFHASRALLFRDGYKEKSHYAIYVYLKEKYSSKIEPKFLNELNILRLERHGIFYGFEEPELKGEDIKKTILIAEEFIKKIEDITAQANKAKK